MYFLLNIPHSFFIVYSGCGGKIWNLPLVRFNFLRCIQERPGAAFNRQDSHYYFLFVPSSLKLADSQKQKNSVRITLCIYNAWCTQFKFQPRYEGNEQLPGIWILGKFARIGKAPRLPRLARLPSLPRLPRLPTSVPRLHRFSRLPPVCICTTLGSRPGIEQAIYINERLNPSILSFLRSHTLKQYVAMYWIPTDL